MDYQTMPAGREMDALVAEKVMGLVPCNQWEYFHADVMMNEYKCGHGFAKCYPKRHGPPLYSNLISAAWHVVQRFRCGTHGHVAAVIEMTVGDDALNPDCTCKIYGADMKEVEATEQEMPLAICRAALMAVSK